MKYFVWILVFLLVILHQDFWFWTDDRLVFGFMPIGMFYHVMISLSAAATWFLVCQFSWPDNLDEEDTGKGGAGK